MDQDSNVKISNKCCQKIILAVVKIVFERFYSILERKTLRIQAISLYYFLDFSF